MTKELITETILLLSFFYHPRRHMCFCSDGPKCEICRTRTAIKQLGEAAIVATNLDKDNDLLHEGIAGLEQEVFLLREKLEKQNANH